MTYELLKVTTEGPVGRIELNRPPVNALNTLLLQEIHRAAYRLNADEKIKAVVLYGAGKHFCGGADVKEIRRRAGDGENSLSEYSRIGHDAFRAIECARVPFIGAVTGHCLGAGCELAMACHFRIADGTAQFGQPEIKLGLIPAHHGTWRLPQLVGRAQALHLLLTGEKIDAADAFHHGLVQKLAPEGKNAIEAALDIARTIAEYSRPIIAGIMEAVGVHLDHDSQPAANRREIELFGMCSHTHDMKEGLDAFLEKRDPSFEDR